MSGIVVYVLVHRALVAQFDDALAVKARALATLVEQDDGRIEYDDLATDTPAGEHFELYAGESLVRSKNLGDAHLDPRDGASRFGRQRAIEFTPRGEDPDATTARPVATIVFARSTADLDVTIAEVRTILVGVALGAIALCIALLAWIARFGLSPVDRLAADIGAVRADTLERLDEQRPAELVPIVARLNELLGRVDGALTRERALTADVAHELRTPLAGLRATIELALDRERAPERYRSALADCLAICVQTERMVESMLSLAKLDAGGVQVERAAVEVDALVRDVLASHAARIADRGLTVTTTLVPTTATTDAAKLASIVHNLVDNAISYAATTIDVRVDGAIRITNDGCTLDSADHVFDRFWRGDTARTAGHTGLGLAICHRLVEVLGGSIRAEVQGKQFVVEVVVDRSRAPA